MKLSAVLFLSLAFLAVSIEAGTLVKRQNKEQLLRGGKKVLRRVRGKARGERQLFGNRVVLNPAPIAPQPLPLAQPFVRAPFPVPAPLPVAQPNFAGLQPIQVIEITPEQARGFQQAEPVQIQAQRAGNSYASPAQVVQQVEEQPEAAIQSVRTAAPVAFTAPLTIASTRDPLAKPIAIMSSVYNAPGMNVNSLNTWDYAFEAENGIKQSAVGEMKTIGDDEVVVMRGSYEYIGADSLTYVVDWEADENGFRASAPHLPKNVPIPFPEVQEAVDAQLRFAEAERSAAARSGDLSSYEQ